MGHDSAFNLIMVPARHIDWDADGGDERCVCFYFQMATLIYYQAPAPPRLNKMNNRKDYLVCRAANSLESLKVEWMNRQPGQSPLILRESKLIVIRLEGRRGNRRTHLSLCAIIRKVNRRKYFHLIPLKSLKIFSFCEGR